MVNTNQSSRSLPGARITQRRRGPRVGRTVIRIRQWRRKTRRRFRSRFVRRGRGRRLRRLRKQDHSRHAIGSRLSWYTDFDRAFPICGARQRPARSGYWGERGLSFPCWGWLGANNNSRYTASRYAARRSHLRQNRLARAVRSRAGCVERFRLRQRLGDLRHRRLAFERAGQSRGFVGRQLRNVEAVVATGAVVAVHIGERVGSFA